MVQEIILRLIEGIEKELHRAFDRLRKHFPHHPKCLEDPRRHRILPVLYVTLNNQKFIIMANLNLKPGKRYTITPGIIDAVNLAPVPGAVIVAVKSNTIDNSAVAVIDADGKAAYVAPGKANLTNITTWQYTDEDTNEQVTADITTTVAITALAAAEVVQGTLSLDNEEDIPASPAAVSTAQQ